MSTVRIREAIAECLADAQSESIDLREKALRTLISITSVSPQNRNLLAQKDGAIPTILILTRKSSSSIVQTLSLSILFNLSLNPNLRQTLAQMETIYHLNSIIASPLSSESSRTASSLVCSLAMLDKNKARFGVAGTVQVLINAISSSGTYSPAVLHILSSLGELVQFHGNCTLAVRAGAVQVLLGVVKITQGEELAGQSLVILSLLARFNEGLTDLIKTEDVVSSMVDVLKGASMLSKEGAADILVRLFDASEHCVRDALRLPEFSIVLADLSVRGSLKAREKATQLMKKLTETKYYSYNLDELSVFHKWQ